MTPTIAAMVTGHGKLTEGVPTSLAATGLRDVRLQAWRPNN